MLDFWGVKIKLKIKQIETLSPENPFSTFLQIKPKTKKHKPVRDLNKKSSKAHHQPQKIRQKQLNITIFHHFFNKFRTKPPPQKNVQYVTILPTCLARSYHPLPFPSPEFSERHKSAGAPLQSSPAPSDAWSG